MMSLDELEPAGKKYHAWVNNRVQSLTLTIQARTTKDLEILLKHKFFLEEIEHHFMHSHADRRVWKTFYYLKRYLKNLPHTKVNHQRSALKMLAFIYDRLGFDGRKILPSIIKNERGNNETQNDKN